MKAFPCAALILLVTSASAKEIKDFSDTEQVVLAMYGTALCLTRAGKSPKVRAALDLNGKWKPVSDESADEMKAYLDLLKRQNGASGTCDLLFIEGLVDKPFDLMDPKYRNLLKDGAR
jgi:hypothetical protein